LALQAGDGGQTWDLVPYLNTSAGAVFSATPLSSWTIIFHNDNTLWNADLDLWIEYTGSSCGAGGQSEVVQYAYPLVIAGEGYCSYCYLDTHKPAIRTVGFGLNLDANKQALAKYLGWTQEHIDAVLDDVPNEGVVQWNDAVTVTQGMLPQFISRAALHVPNFWTLPLPVQATLTDISYTVGKWDQFAPVITALQSHDYAGAATALSETQWCKNVKTRCPRDVELINNYAQYCSAPTASPGSAFSRDPCVGSTTVPCSYIVLHGIPPSAS